MSVAAFLARFLEPMGECLDAESARRIVEFEVPAGVQERVEALAEQANEGLLSDEEWAEYEALIDAGDLVSILKSQARRRLVEVGAASLCERSGRDGLL